MPPEFPESRLLDQLVNAARPVALLLALLGVREAAPSAAGRWAIVYLAAYLAFAVVLVLAERATRFPRIPFLPEIDAVALAIFLPLTPSLTAFWFFYLFTAFELAARSRSRCGTGSSRIALRPGHLLASDGAWLSAGAAVAVFVRATWLEPPGSTDLLRWFSLGAGTYLSGLAMAWLGRRERALVHEDRFIESLV